MNSNIIRAVEGRIKEGPREAFQNVMNDMIKATREEEGTLSYEWSLSEDGTSLHVYERYKNAKAAMAHLETWGTLAARFTSVVDITRIVVYSSLPSELKAALSGAVFMTPVGGFAR